MKLEFGKTYRIIEDAVSNFKTKNGKSIIYAHAGDHVKLIADLDNVVILEKHNKKRFPTETKNIVEIKDLFTQ